MYAFKLVNLSIITPCRKRFVRSYCERSDNIKSLLLKTMSKNKEKVNSIWAKIGTEDKKQFVPSVQPYLEVLGSGAKGAPTCVLLHTDNLYVINCGEGTMKLAGEYKVKAHKAINVFITYPSWNNVSGLIALALAIQNNYDPKICIHGDTCIRSIFSAVTKFVKLRKLKINMTSCTHYKEFKDDSVNVKYILIPPNSFVNLNENNSDSAVGMVVDESENSNIDDGCGSDIRKLFETFCDQQPSHVSRKNEWGKKYKRDRTQSENCAHARQEINKKLEKCAVSFIFTTHPTPGSLILEKCLEYNVPPGPLLGQLKRGIDVTLDNGSVIRSQDVKEPDKPGITVVAVECPTEDYLESLLEEPIFSEYQSGENPASAVVHFTPSQVVKNLKYKDWINRFSKKTRHLFINEDNNQATSVAIHRQQFKLNLLQPDLFPLLSEPEIPNFPRKSNSTAPDGHLEVSLKTPPDRVPIYMDRVFYKCDSDNFIKGETLCRVYLRQGVGCDYYKCLVLNKEEFFNEIFVDDSVKEIIEEYKNNLREVENQLKSNNKIYPKIVFLGTGSSKPSKTRAQSGILIFTGKDKCIMFDCGEYTYGQIMNRYGEKKAGDILKNLHAIYISHMHADHHLGLITLLKKRKEFFNEVEKMSMKESFQPVYVFAPIEIFRWLTLFSETFEDISNFYELIPNSAMLHGTTDSSPRAKLCKKILNLKSLETIPVEHCPGAFGVSIVHEEGWKITYSGDTKPCRALVKLGKGSNILIHEATFEDALVKEAVIKAHSTTKQAIDIGREMMAENILLTHFSQKYSNLPKIENVVSTLNIGIAFDFMEVPYNKLPLLKKVIKPLQYIFPKHYNINEKRTKSYLESKKKLWKAAESLKRYSQDEKEVPAKVIKSSIKN